MQKDVTTMTSDEARGLTPPEPTPGTSSEPDGTAWAKWIDERIDLKLRRERRFNRAVMAEAISLLIAQQKKPAKRSVSKRRAEGSLRAR
jgi:hypothetical protein